MAPSLDNEIVDLVTGNQKQGPVQKGDGAMETGTKHMKGLGWLGMLLASVLLVASVAAAVEVG